MTSTPSTSKISLGRRRERDAFSDKEAAKMLGIPVGKLYRICDFFDSNSDDAWDLTEGDFFEYEPGQARKRRFYEEGVMAIANYLEETEGGGFLARLKEFFTHHRARVTRALVQRRIIQVTQDRSDLVIRGDLVFLQQRSVVRVLGTNGKGMSGTLRRIEEESAGLDGAEGLEIDVHFADFEDAEGRHWSQRGIARLARTMQERGRITKARKAWVKAVADVAEDCFEVQRKVLESHEARVKAAMARARNKAKACAVTQQKPNAADRNPIELEAHHLFDAASRPDLAAVDDNLLVISSALHRNFHKWMGSRPCEPKDFVDYLLRNELTHFAGSPSTRARQEARQQQLIHRLEMLQARYEGNRLLY
jgi:AraC-like DNA-binding protein